MTRTVVVLGSNAFSGQDLIDLLLDDPGYRVIGVSRSAELPAWRLRYRQRGELSRLSIYRMDFNRDMDALLSLLDIERPWGIVNFAAQSEVAPSWEHPEHWFETNTVALARLVNHLRRRDYLERYVHISSPEVYGTCVGTVREDAPMNPSTPYAASKAAADLLLATYQKQFNFPLLTVRATNVYGARQQLFKIIPRTAIYLRMGRKIPLHGGGKAVKSYIHVRDVSRGELDVLERGRAGELYHLSPDAGVAVRDVVARLAVEMDVPFEDAVEIVAERPGQDAAYVIDSSKARGELGWKPTIGLHEGLSEVVTWVQENFDAIAATELGYV
ncbi:MAG: GDP-mannose 4,6-dehydratase, partial [Phycisphaeraceae bacterium]|nr:GDP-mannose 4,6-dehydratase [Phycisphaeraceae bacterium]